MEAVEYARDQEEFLLTELDSASREKNLADKIRQVYKDQGIEMSEDAIQKGVKEFLGRRFRHLPPKDNFLSKFAETYIDRGVICKKILEQTKKFAIITGCIMLPATAISIGINTVKQRNLMNVYEETTAGITKKKQEVKELVSSFEYVAASSFPEGNSPEVKQGILIKSQAFESQKFMVGRSIEKLLKQMEEIPQPLIPSKDTQPGEYTQEDREKTNLHARQVLQETDSVQEIKNKIQELETLLREAEKLPGIHTRGDTSIAAMKNNFSENEKAVRRANTLKEQLNSELSKGSVRQASQTVVAMQRLLEETRVLQELPKLIEEALLTATNLSNDKSADKSLEKLKQDGIAFTAAGNTGAAQSTLKQIEEISVKLAQEYEIILYQHSGEKTGVWRYPNDNPGQKNHYLIVEAKDSSGKTMVLDITNEETGKTSRTSKWAELVSEAEFEAVKTEKQRYGVIKAGNNVIARKVRGKLNPNYLKGPKTEQISDMEGSRITSW